MQDRTDNLSFLNILWSNDESFYLLLTTFNQAFNLHVFFVNDY